jgi:hypothetical protein
MNISLAKKKAKRGCIQTSPFTMKFSGDMKYFHHNQTYYIHEEVNVDKYHLYNVTKCSL